MPFTALTQLLPWADVSANAQLLGVRMSGVECDRKAAAERTATVAAALVRHLEALGAATDCANRSALLVAKPLVSGWLASLHSIVKPLMHAHKGGRTLLSPAMSEWAPADRCAARDLSCFFEPLAPPCDAARVDRARIETLKMPEWVDA